MYDSVTVRFVSTSQSELSRFENRGLMPSIGFSAVLAQTCYRNFLWEDCTNYNVDIMNVHPAFDPAPSRWVRHSTMSSVLSFGLSGFISLIQLICLCISRTSGSSTFVSGTSWRHPVFYLMICRSEPTRYEEAISIRCDMNFSYELTL